MEAIDTGILFAFIGCIVGLAGWLHGRDKQVASDAKWRGSVDAKLDVIVGLKSDVAELGHTVSQHSISIAKLETSNQLAHQRIDNLIKREEDCGGSNAK